MPSWSDLVQQFGAMPNAEKGDWLRQQQIDWMNAVSANRSGRNVVLYASAFLQKPLVPPVSVSITHEDLNGLMSVIHGMDWNKGLSLILHTPGGVTNATESLVAYLRTKFDDIEVIVPALAMSGGTMIALAADRIIMGRQSQLGPIDPQMNMAGSSVSARAVVEQFDRAKAEITGNLTVAHVWAPILQSLGPALLQEAQNALDYSEQMVAKWLTNYMFKGDPDGATKGAAIAHHFNDATTHKSHGRRIDRDEARAQGVRVDDLEDDQELQEAVLTSYHLMTIAIENSPMAKVMASNTGQTWIKNFVTPEQAQQIAQQQGQRQAGPPRPPQQQQNRAQRRAGQRR